MISVFKKYAALVFVFGVFGSVFGASAERPPMTDLELQMQAKESVEKASLMLKETEELLENLPSIMSKTFIANRDSVIAHFTEELGRFIVFIKVVVDKCQKAVSVFAKGPVSSSSLSLGEILIIGTYLEGLDQVEKNLDLYKSQIYQALEFKYCKVCLSCPAMGDHVEISSCGRCRTVQYCSPDCQKKRLERA